MCTADLVTLAGAALIASLLGLLVPLATGMIIDTFLPGQMRGQLLLLGVMLGVGQLCAALLRISSDVARLRIDGRLAVRLQGGVIDRVLRLPTIMLPENYYGAALPISPCWSSPIGLAGVTCQWSVR